MDFNNPEVRARKLLTKFSRIEKEFETGTSEDRRRRNEKMDAMIVNIGDPRVAEKLRIYKLVEDQFERIEKQVKEEVRMKMEEVKKEREALGPLARSKAKEVLVKAKLKEMHPKRSTNSGVRLLTPKKSLVEGKIKNSDKNSSNLSRDKKFVKPSEVEKSAVVKKSKLDVVKSSKVFPTEIGSKSKLISEKPLESKARTNVMKIGSESEVKMEIEKPKYDPARFEVLSDVQTNISFQMLKPPLIIDKSSRIRSDKSATKMDIEKNGLFKMKHVDEKVSLEKLKKMSCHRLPGVNIRPELVKENIPGFSFMGFDRKPNKKISVQHVVDRRNLEPKEESIDLSELSDKDLDLKLRGIENAEVFEQLAERRIVDKDVERKNVEIVEEENEYFGESGRETNRSECLEDFSITDSTTSKFEVLEKMLLQKARVSEEDGSKMLLHKAGDNEEGGNKVELKATLGDTENAEQFKIEVEELAKQMIRAKVAEILDQRKQKLGKSVAEQETASQEVIKEDESSGEMEDEESNSHEVMEEKSDNKEETLDGIKVDSRESFDSDSKKQSSEEYSMSFEAESDEKEVEDNSSGEEQEEENKDVEGSTENVPVMEVVIKEKDPIDDSNLDKSGATSSETDEEEAALDSEEDKPSSAGDKQTNIDYSVDSFESNSKEGRRNYAGVDILSTIEEVSTIASSASQDDSNLTLEKIEVDEIDDHDQSDGPEGVKDSEFSDTLIPNVKEIDFEKDLSENEFELSHGDLSLELSINLEDDDDEEQEPKSEGIRNEPKEMIDSENEFTLDRIDSIQADNDQTDLEEDVKEYIETDSVADSNKDAFGVKEDDKATLKSSIQKDEVVTVSKNVEVEDRSEENSKTQTESHIEKEATRTEDLADRSENISDKSFLKSKDDKSESLVESKTVGITESPARHLESNVAITESPARHSESDHPSSEPLLSEGEIVQGRRGSEGEISLGGSSFLEAGTASFLEADSSKKDGGKMNQTSTSEGEVSARHGPEVSSDDQGKMNKTGGGVESSSGVGEYLADYSASDGEAALRVAKKKSTSSNSNRLRNIGQQRLSQTDTSTTSSFSEGEWGAEVSPRQTQRFRNMAAAFRLNKK